MNIRQLSEMEISQLEQMSLGKRLKWIREQLQDIYKTGYTINQVAKNINISDEKGSIITAQGLSAIEMGKTKNPSVRTINALADYYHIQSEVLFDEYYKNNPSSLMLGDVDFSAGGNLKTIACEIRISSDYEKYFETVKLSPRQIEILVKRIKLEISLLLEEQQ
jgi:transcriptional regulator with XRE-family HTH domain